MRLPSMTRKDLPRTPPPDEAIDDGMLFRSAIGHVRHVIAPPQAEPPPKPKPVARQRQLDDIAVMRELLVSPIDEIDIDGTEALSYARDGQSPKVLRKLKRGGFAVQDELDLHQLRADEAQSILAEFIAHARNQSCLCVRIVHGKGLRSTRGPVLKALVDRWLRHRIDVLAFCSAPARDGGTGAVLVLLQSLRRH